MVAVDAALNVLPALFAFTTGISVGIVTIQRKAGERIA